MKWGIVKMHRDEYSNGHLAVRDYYISVFGIPIYSARFTSTNNQAINQLTVLDRKQLQICGFTTK